MSDSHASRSLLLERLESRCLLAAGFFASSDGPDESVQDRQPQPRPGAPDRSDRPAEVRLHEQPAKRHTLNRQPANQRETGSHEQRRGPARIDPPRHDRPIAATRPIPPVRTPVVQTLLPRAIDRSGPLIPPSSARASSARDVDATESQPNRASDPLGQVSSVTPETIRSANDQTDTESTRTVESVAARSEALEPATNRGASTDRSVDQRQVLTDVQGQSESNIGGVIEAIAMRNTKPSNRQLPRSQRESADDDSWQIDRETIEELREINRNPDHSQPGIADQARLDWFSGPGGLIELESDGGALPIVDAAGMIVDIPLDVIFGLHRSLDLVAVADTSEAETAIRDVILAAIAGEQVDHAVPINETAKQGLHPIAYSSVALIATTLVLASRRRQSNVLFKTRGGQSGGSL